MGRIPAMLALILILPLGLGCEDDRRKGRLEAANARNNNRAENGGGENAGLICQLLQR